MRCPKCGFHSFDYLDSCKKCGGDLTELKLRCKFQGFVAPPATEATSDETMMIMTAPDFPEVAEAEAEAIDFGFDVLDQEPATVPATTVSAIAPASDSFADDDDGSDRDPFAIDFANHSGLSLEQPFTADSENVPEDGLPKIGNRFDF